MQNRIHPHLPSSPALHDMGCTSSAHSTMPPSPTVNATELDHISEEMIKSDELREPQADVKMELPARDTLMDQADVDTASAVRGLEAARVPGQIDPSMSIETLIAKDKEFDDDNQIEASEDHTRSQENIARDSEEKISRLDEVVEKVVELFVTKSVTVTPEKEVIKEFKMEEVKSHNPEPSEAIATTTIDVEEKAPEKEPVSPSKSASSRATRWEALADIAAELPPSLTVDPLTGQIYTLSK